MIKVSREPATGRVTATALSRGHDMVSRLAGGTAAVVAAAAVARYLGVINSRRDPASG